MTRLLLSFMNLIELRLLPVNWIESITETLKESAIRVYLDGHHPDTREYNHSLTKETTYDVVPGDQIAKRIPWLFSLYTEKLRGLISDLVRRQLSPAIETKVGVNINVLFGPGRGYEWHVDPNPITAVLFVTEHSESEGGQLAIRLPSEILKISPQPGILVIFEGRYEHAVLPLLSTCTRVSIPMCYFLADQPQSIYPELIDYLYSPVSLRAEV